MTGASILGHPQGGVLALVAGAAFCLLGLVVHGCDRRYLTRAIRKSLLRRLRERERIGLEVQDSLLQSHQAFALRIQLVLDALPPTDARRIQIEAAIESVDEVMASAKRRLGDLRERAALEDPEAALRDDAVRQLARTSIAYIGRSKGLARPLAAAAWRELASIASEAILNIARHSHASVVTAELRYRASSLSLKISDDGIGLRPHLARDGASDMPGMRRRARRLGGSFRIVRRPRGGAEVTVTLPAESVYAGERRIWWKRWLR